MHDVETNIEHAQRRQKNYDARNKSHVAIEKGKFVLIKNNVKDPALWEQVSPPLVGSV